MEKRSLAQYLTDEIREGKIDFALRAHETPDGVQFYIHPQGRDGHTADFVVQGQLVWPIQDTKDSEKVDGQKS